ncbi:MAG: hypothetical protein M3247_05555, partial [Thermoproteota archaeon]|nr:hypothetical protein [Acidobacteriota bacterium]MDQ3903085.1 hypothetical protein [Thermoproteota archaeon]
MKQTIRILILFSLFLILAVPSSSQPKDVVGWQGTRWGMSEQDLIGVFGSRLKKLPKRMDFLKWHVDYVIPEFQLENNIYTVFFQMDDKTNKLAQVLIRLNEMESQIPREQIFNNLVSLLTREYGSPSGNADNRYSFLVKYKGIDLSRTWKFPTTTIELGYGWDSQ